MSTTKQEEDKAFRDGQKAKAAEQGMTGDNAVPEQRPIASQEPNSSQTSTLTQKLIDNGNFDPMSKEAYDKANRKPTKAELRKEKVPSLKVGDRVRVMDRDHVHYGSAGAVTSVTYKNDTEANKARSGDPAIANYAQISDLMIRTRGGSHALVSLKPNQVKKIDVLGVNSSVE